MIKANPLNDVKRLTLEFVGLGTRVPGPAADPWRFLWWNVSRGAPP